MRQIAATRRHKSPRVAWENHCHCDRILSPQYVAGIQHGLNSCDISQPQNKSKRPCRSMCTHLRQVAETKFKSTNEGASISFPPCKIWTSLHFLSYKIDCVHRTSALLQRLVTQMRRSDLSHRVSQPLSQRHTMQEFAATYRGDNSPRLHWSCDKSLQ